MPEGPAAHVHVEAEVDIAAPVNQEDRPTAEFDATIHVQADVKVDVEATTEGEVPASGPPVPTVTASLEAEVVDKDEVVLEEKSIEQQVNPTAEAAELSSSTSESNEASEVKLVEENQRSPADDDSEQPPEPAPPEETEETEETEEAIGTSNACFRNCALITVVLLLPLVLVLALLPGLLYLMVMGPIWLYRRWKRRDLPTDTHWNLDELPYRKDRNARYRRARYSSCWITLKDGTKLACDYYVPEGAEKRKVAAVLHQCRYCRSFTLYWPIRCFVNWGRPVNLVGNSYTREIVGTGDMAMVQVDVRGTGASGGVYKRLWSADEQSDSQEILDWIVAQPWSDGRVGLWGLSYDANVAAFTVAQHHPSVKACVSMFYFWDLYRSLVYPGGVMLRSFAETWQSVNNILDSNDLAGMGWFIPYLTRGVTPVEGDEVTLRRHIRGHKDNWDACVDINAIRFKDDTAPSAHCKAEDMSLYAHAAELESSNTPCYLYTGWMDGSVMDCFANLKAGLPAGSEMIIGPWNHGGSQAAHLREGSRMSSFPHEREVLRFLLDHMPPSQHSAAGLTFQSPPPPVPAGSYRMRYFTMGHYISQHGPSQWTSTIAPRGTPPWPTEEGAGVTAYYLDSSAEHVEDGPDFFSYMPDLTDIEAQRAAAGGVKGYKFRASGGALRLGEPSEEEAQAKHIMTHYKFANGSSRWSAMLEPQNLIEYDMSGVLQTVFTTKPLVSPMEVTGSPIVEFFVGTTSPHRDVDLYAYLLCVRPDDVARYVSEGVLRASHRLENREELDSMEWQAQPFEWIPYHSHTLPDRKYLPMGAPVKLRFALMPTSTAFQKGDRLAVCVAGCDLKHFLVEHKEHEFSIHTGGNTPSRLLLPNGPARTQVDEVAPDEIVVQVNPSSADGGDALRDGIPSTHPDGKGGWTTPSSKSPKEDGGSRNEGGAGDSGVIQASASGVSVKQDLQEPVAVRISQSGRQGSKMPHPTCPYGDAVLVA